MINEMTADEIRALLKLEPHATCGFVRVTFISQKRIVPDGLPPPFAQGRPAGSALYFIVTPDAPVQLHSIRNDQLYHYYLGDPIEVLMLRTYGTTERVVVGPDLRSGQRVQLFIPGNTFHTARVVGQRQWFLGASTEWPGVEPDDVEIGDVDVWPKNIRTRPMICALSSNVGAIDLNRLGTPGLRGKRMVGCECQARRSERPARWSVPYQTDAFERDASHDLIHLWGK